jgi:hypothetical protein
MKKITLLMVIALMAISMLASAGVIVGMNAHVYVNTPGQSPANDFHVQGTVRSAGAVFPILSSVWVAAHPNGGIWQVTGTSIVQDTVDPELFHVTLDYAVDQIATPGAVLSYNPANPEWLHFGAIYTVNTCNVMVNMNGWFTLWGNRIGQGVPLTGFVVVDPAQPLEEGVVEIHNNSEVPVEVTTLELCVLSEPVPLEDMFSTGLGLPGQNGTGGYPPATAWEEVPHDLLPILQPGQFFSIPLGDTRIGINLQPGQFLLMRGYQKEEGVATNLKVPAPFWNQHEEPNLQ